MQVICKCGAEIKDDEILFFNGVEQPYNLENSYLRLDVRCKTCGTRYKPKEYTLKDTFEEAKELLINYINELK